MCFTRLPCLLPFLAFFGVSLSAEVIFRPDGFSAPVVKNLMVPVLDHDPALEGKGFPVADIVLNEAGQPIGLSLINVRGADLVTALRRMVAGTEFTPAYIDGQAATGLLRHFVDIYLVCEEPVTDEEVEFIPPLPNWLFSDALMEQVEMMSRLVDEERVSVRLTINAAGVLQTVESTSLIGRAIGTYLNRLFSGLESFIPARLNGQPVPWELELVFFARKKDLYRAEEAISLATIKRVASEAPPVATQANGGRQPVSIDLALLCHKGVVRSIRPLEGGPAPLLMAAYDAARRWPGAAYVDATPQIRILRITFPAGEQQGTLSLADDSYQYSMPQVTRPQEIPVPDSLRGVGGVGMVVLGYVINRQGRVRDIEVLATTHEALGETAVETARGWRFQAGRLNRRTIDMHVRQVFTIELGN